MKDGITIGMTEFSLAAILITVCVVATGFFYIHRPFPVQPALPCPTASTMGPTIEIDQTIYVPVPVQTQVQAAPETPAAPQEEEQEQEDPVFQHRQVIVTDALKRPMSYTEASNVGPNGN